MSPWPPDPPESDGDADDNIILMPGVDRIPEPSPLRVGGPSLGADIDDGLERIDPDEQPPPHLLDAAVEALLFASDTPMTETRIDGHLGNPGVAEVRAALTLLKARYAERGGGVRLVQVAHGWQLRSDPRFGRWVTRMLGGKPLKLSKAALEVLAIVAYRQPATKAEVDDLRGVDSGGVLRMLVERGMVHVTGRRDEPGRPLIYGSSPEFLSIFGLRDLSELPTLRDLHELQHDDPRLGPLPDVEVGRPAQPQQPLPLLGLLPDADGAGDDESAGAEGVDAGDAHAQGAHAEGADAEGADAEDADAEDADAEDAAAEDAEGLGATLDSPDDEDEDEDAGGDLLQLGAPPRDPPADRQPEQGSPPPRDLRETGLSLVPDAPEP